MTAIDMDASAAAPAAPTFAEAAQVWAKIGLLSFGGPAGQIALMHKELGGGAPLDRRAALPALPQLLHIILAAGLIGWIGSRQAPQLFAAGGNGRKEAVPDVKGVVDVMFERGELAHAEPSWRRTLRVLAIWLPIWLGPVLLLWMLTGTASVWT